MEHGKNIVSFIDIDEAKIGRHPFGIPVAGPELAEESDLPFVIGAVAVAGARRLIREALERAGKQEERDFLFVQ